MTPERLAELERLAMVDRDKSWTWDAWRVDDILDLIAHIRDLEAQLAAAREASLVRRALVSHAMWCAFQMGAGLPFNEEPTEAQLQSQIDGLRAFDANPSMTAEENHANWMQFKLANGWRYGPVKDETAKTHPDLVPFGDLPRIEALKDEMDLMSRRVGVRATATPPSPEVE